MQLIAKNPIHDRQWALRSGLSTEVAFVEYLRIRALVNRERVTERSPYAFKSTLAKLDINRLQSILPQFHKETFKCLTIK